MLEVTEEVAEYPVSVKPREGLELLSTRVKRRPEPFLSFPEMIFSLFLGLIVSPATGVCGYT